MPRRRQTSENPGAALLAAAAASSGGGGRKARRASGAALLGKGGARARAPLQRASSARARWPRTHPNPGDPNRSKASGGAVCEGLGERVGVSERNHASKEVGEASRAGFET
jgi:hypothetical protein